MTAFRVKEEQTLNRKKLQKTPGEGVTLRNGSFIAQRPAEGWVKLCRIKSFRHITAFPRTGVVCLNITSNLMQ